MLVCADVYANPTPTPSPRCGAAHDVLAQRGDAAGVVSELRRLEAEGGEALLHLGGQVGHRLADVGAGTVVGEHRAGAADELERLDAAPGGGACGVQPGEVVGARFAERVESVAVADQPAQQRFVHALTAEPHARAVRPVCLGLEVDLVEGEELAADLGAARA